MIYGPSNRGLFHCSLRAYLVITQETPEGSTEKSLQKYIPDTETQIHSGFDFFLIEFFFNAPKHLKIIFVR